MVRSVPKVLLWLFVMNLGIAFGAGIYESRIVVPQWLSGSPQSGYQWNAEAARQANTGVLGPRGPLSGAWSWGRILQRRQNSRRLDCAQSLAAEIV